MKSKVYIGTSLDGFIARKDGDFSWLSQFANDEAINAYEEFINSIDAIVIGKGTFEKVLTFPSWPYTKKVFVLSTSLKEVPGSVKEKVIILSMQPKDLLSYLSGLGILNIYIDGGSVIQNFLKEDLVDEQTLQLRKILKTPLEDLDLSVRAFNCLKAAKINSLSELVQYEQEDLMKFRNFGQKSLAEIEQVLNERGLHFGMDLGKLGLDKDDF